MDKETIGKKLQFYKDKNTPIHIAMDGSFKNGFIVSIHADFVMLNDFVFGELPVFFAEIIDITPYKSKEERGND